jgi:hypothetical protein
MLIHNRILQDLCILHTKMSGVPSRVNSWLHTSNRYYNIKERRLIELDEHYFLQYLRHFDKSFPHLKHWHVLLVSLKWFWAAGDKLPLFFCENFHRQGTTGSEEIDSMDIVSSLLAIITVFQVCPSVNLPSYKACFLKLLGHVLIARLTNVRTMN